MERDDTTEAGTVPDVALVPAASIGFLLYPWVVQLIVANPPANDAGKRAPTP
jgi:hypothetical protein